MSVENICPGIVIIRKILNIDEQCRIIDIVTRHGGLKNNEDMWNFLEMRGRTFDSINNYPKEDRDFLKDCFERMRSLISEAALSNTGFTHMLTWWYPDKKGMGWHFDGYGGNNGDIDAPVYSLTIGNTCIFDWKLVDQPDVLQSAELTSGDLIVFGGAQRMMKHRVRRVILNSFVHPYLEDFNARINITFRKLENFTPEDEKQYQTDMYEEKVLKEYHNP